MPQIQEVTVTVDVEDLKRRLPELKLALEIADEAAIVEIQSGCVSEYDGADGGSTWYDTSNVDEYAENVIKRAVQYLEMSGQLERKQGAPEWVRFVDRK